MVVSKGCKPDNVELHKSLKLSCMNTIGRCSNFVEHEPFLESNSPDTLPLLKTSLDDSIGSGTLSVMGYLPLIRKDSVSHMHGLVVYLKEEIPFAWVLSLENSANSYL